MLVSAEVLKLRRRYGMLVIAILLTLGIVAVVFAVTGFRHASDPTRYGPAGGAKNWADGVRTLALMASVIGVIVGATAGTQDIESGVFRDLAATGRSRVALFGARVAGAWAIVLPLLAVTMATMGVLSVALAGSAATPTSGALASGTVGVLVAGAMSCAVAVGLSALVGSRGPVIGTLLAFFLALNPLLAQVSFLGGARDALPSVAVQRIGHLAVDGDVRLALATAIAGVLAWVAITLGLGAWKTATREI